VPEASVFNANEPPIRAVRGLVSDPERLIEPVWSRRMYGVVVAPPTWLTSSTPRGKASHLQGPRVIDWNAGTHVRAPVGSKLASSSESSDGRTWGRSSRSSPRSGKPTTWQRGAGTSWGSQKEE
jgi:hypothetical protein